ncbi:MAG: AAA family ATPase, partial [Chloroflexia bacterium]|nr:AAA family ATPase [Chloroflexia bacterium]
MIRHVVLVGLSGSGKSSVGRCASRDLGWELFDTDAEIERRTGRSIPDLFRDEGEARFREIEAVVLREVLTKEHVVIATGGGAVAAPEAWTPDLLGSPDSFVVWLDAKPATLVDRLETQAANEGAAANRPLLADGDALEKIAAMRERRQASYARADVTLDVTTRSADDVSRDVAELVRLGRGEESLVTLQVANAASAIHIGNGVRHRVGDLIQQRWPRAQQIWAVVDGNLLPHIEPVVESIQSQSAARANVLAVPPGEGSKSLDGVSRLYDWMLNGGVERGDVVVALGGGMVGDLAGYAAATVLRGVG